MTTYRAALRAFALQSMQLEMGETGSPRRALNAEVSAKVIALQLPGQTNQVGLWVMTMFRAFQERKPTKRDDRTQVDLAHFGATHFAILDLLDEAPSPLDADQLDEFALTIGLDQVFPSLQEFVVDVTRRMSFPPLMIDRRELAVELLDRGELSGIAAN